MKIFIFEKLKKIINYFFIFYKKFIKSKINIYFFYIMTKFLKFLQKSDRGGMLCPWGQNMGFWRTYEWNESKRFSFWDPSI
jgi:hypothetical protein